MAHYINKPNEDVTKNKDKKPLLEMSTNLKAPTSMFQDLQIDDDV